MEGSEGEGTLVVDWAVGWILNYGCFLSRWPVTPTPKSSPLSHLFKVGLGWHVSINIYEGCKWSLLNGQGSLLVGCCGHASKRNYGQTETAITSLLEDFLGPLDSMSLLGLRFTMVLKVCWLIELSLLVNLVKSSSNSWVVSQGGPLMGKPFK